MRGAQLWIEPTSHPRARAAFLILHLCGGTNPREQQANTSQMPSAATITRSAIRHDFLGLTGRVCPTTAAAVCARAPRVRALAEQAAQEGHGDLGRTVCAISQYADEDSWEPLVAGGRAKASQPLAS